MPFTLAKTMVSSLAVAALLNCGSAYAADNSEAAADGSFATASEEATPTSVTVVTANGRETNLRRTATAIVVLSDETGKSERKHQ